MENVGGLQVSKRALVQTVVMLLVLMWFAGVLTRVLPAGQYTRIEMAGRQVIDPQSYREVAPPDYPIWRWLTAPLEVLAGPDSLTIIVIIIFLLLIGGSFAALDASGLLQAILVRLVRTFAGRKYQLLAAIALFFMVLGATAGILEEVVPLVPLMVALSLSLGWDSLVGLGMSILATNIGFSAALTNPFTIGVAQRLAGLPLFSGMWLRLPIFAIMYVFLVVFLTGYARKIERQPESSLVYEEEQAIRDRYRGSRMDLESGRIPGVGRAVAWLAGLLVLILFVLVAGPFVPALSDLALPLVGLLFFVAGIGAALLAGQPHRQVMAAAVSGVVSILPAVILILLAASVKHIVVMGGILDTILHGVATRFSGSSAIATALLILGLALLIEFFVASGSAKAVLLMPILLPLGDLIGVTRQTSVLAYCFGDGFANLFYPTNPVLLISLGLTAVSYPKWIRWSARLWLGIGALAVIFLTLAVVTGYGPF